MKTYKDCDGAKIDKCKDCDYTHLPYCRKINKYDFNTEIRNILTIPSWCPLKDYIEPFFKRKSLGKQYSTDGKWNINNT